MLVWVEVLYFLIVCYSLWSVFQDHSTPFSIFIWHIIHYCLYLSTILIFIYFTRYFWNILASQYSLFSISLTFSLSFLSLIFIYKLRFLSIVLCSKKPIQTLIRFQKCSKCRLKMKRTCLRK